MARLLIQNMAKPDYMTAGTHGKGTNQVEFVIEEALGVLPKRCVGGLRSDTEYGNSNSYAYSSSSM